MSWLLLVLSLPTENATARMRAWRALKASGAAVLRDGVYLLPQRSDCRATLDAVAAAVVEGGGSAHVIAAEPSAADAGYQALFDRTEDYAAVLRDVQAAHAALNPSTASEALKLARRSRKLFAGIEANDFFPGEARRQTGQAVQALETSALRAASPDEPHAIAVAVRALRLTEYQQRVWVTRARPWVDRLASAWLIRRFIDPQARFLWLADTSRAPAHAVGFDFDGAVFSHVGARVTFEVLLASFELEQPALHRVGAIVHFLDAGGIAPPEAAGVERVLAGMRAAIADDNQLFLTGASIFEGLWVAFDKDPAS